MSSRRRRGARYVDTVRIRKMFLLENVSYISKSLVKKNTGLDEKHELRLKGDTCCRSNPVVRTKAVVLRLS